MNSQTRKRDASLGNSEETKSLSKQSGIMVNSITKRKPKFNVIFLVMEYHGHDMRTIMRSIKNGTMLNERHILTLMYNMLCGLKFMH